MAEVKVDELGLDVLRKKMEQYVAKLPLKDQERVREKADKLAIKHYLKGVSIKCIKCNKGTCNSETGPLMKMDSGKYAHKNCLVLKI